MRWLRQFRTNTLGRPTELVRWVSSGRNRLAERRRLVHRN